MKGKIHVTSGINIVKIIDGDTVGRGDLSKTSSSLPPGRGEGFIQVHHFKWDSTVLERLKEVSETEEDYTFWKEYKKMYEAIRDSDWKINVDEPKFGLENKFLSKMNIGIIDWNRLTKGIIKI